MAVNITDRSAVEALIREQIVSTIFQDAPKQSAFMGMARKLPNMTSKQTRIRVLDFLPTAYWVDGDTGMKQTSMQAWDNVYLTAAELAVIVPIPESVFDDAEIDILGEITPRVNEAIGQRVDAAIIFGDNRPREWQADIITLARQAGNNVSPSSGKDYYDLTLGEGGVFSKVEDDGYAVTGAIAPMTFKSKLRGLRDSNKQPIFTHNMQDSSKYALDGVPIQFPENGSFMPDIAQLVVGDFSKAVYAIRQDITVKLLTEGVIQDPNTKDIVYKGGLRYADKRLCKTGITGGGARAVFYWNVAETERNGKRQVYPINKWRYRRADLRDLCLRHLRVFQWSGYCSGCVYGTDAGRSCSRIIHLRKSAFKTIK